MIAGNNLDIFFFFPNHLTAIIIISHPVQPPGFFFLMIFINHFEHERIVL